MCPMSPRLLRPRSTGFHPEAQAWRNAVIANGGAVSGSTLTAVSNFCRSIDAAGIRDRFVRLSLMCGTGLEACLVPLYRGESRTATQFGNATDTNNNFVSGDYSETGISSGLSGDGISKYLDTGLLANTLSGSNQHLGVGLRENRNSGIGAGKDILGVFDNSQAQLVSARRGDVLNSAIFGDYSTTDTSFGDLVENQNLAIGNICASWPTMFRDATATGAEALSASNYESNTTFFVFASHYHGVGAFGISDMRINWYSVGLAMNAAQVVAFNSAIDAFNTALSRT